MIDEELEKLRVYLQAEKPAAGKLKGTVKDIILKDSACRNFLIKVCIDTEVLQSFMQESTADVFFINRCKAKLVTDYFYTEELAEKAIRYCQFLTNKPFTPIRRPPTPVPPKPQPILQPIVQPQPKPVPGPTPTPLPKVPVQGKPKPKRTLVPWLLLIVVIIVVGIIAIYWPKTTSDVQTIVQGTPISKNPEVENKRIADSLDTAKKLAAREKAIRDSIDAFKAIENKRVADSISNANKLAAREKAVRDAAAKDSVNDNQAKRQNTIDAYQNYLNNFTDGKYRKEAKQLYDKILEDIEKAKNDSLASLNKTKPITQTQLSGNYIETVNGVSFNMIAIKGGTFSMGSSDGEPDEKPVHSVTVSDFYMGKTEITISQFKAFIDATAYQTDADKDNGSYFWTDKWEKRAGTNWKYDADGNIRSNYEYNHPVIHVSWNDAVAFCEWMVKKTGKTYRLPTEAEWEYAAGNGSAHTKYSWGNENPTGKNGGNVADESKRPKDSVSWSTKFEGYNDGYWFTAPVGSYNNNKFGLNDMTGNVWEWCSDWYDGNYYANSPQNNPKGASTGSGRVLRGGSWNDYSSSCRVSYRNFSIPDFRDSYYGFRLVRVP